MPHHNVCNNIGLSSYHPLRSTPCNGLHFPSGYTLKESSDLEEAAAQEGSELEEHNFSVSRASETYQQGHQQHSPKTFDTPWEKKKCYVDTRERN